MSGTKRSRVQKNYPTSSSSSSTTIVGDGENQEVPSMCGSSRNLVENVSLVSGQNENPLMNHLVLSTLFEYVKPVDLQTCRMVCQTWNVIAVPFVRAKCKVTIQQLDYSKPGNQRRRKDRKENRNFSAFVKLMRSNTTGIPFSKFNWEAYKGTELVKRTFLRICGYGIKEMNLSRCDISLRHLSQILCNVPNIECFTTPWHLTARESIKLFPDDFNPKPRLHRLKTLGIVDGLNVKKEVFSILFKELFEAAENISNIVFMDYIPLEQFDYVLEVLNVIECIGRESAIQSLSVSKLTKANVEILKRMILKDKGLKLKKLMIRYDGGMDDVWFQLASLCKDDLVELSSIQQSGRRVIYNPAAYEFPVMNKLKLLEVTLPSGRSSFLHCNLKNTFPILEKLSIWNRFTSGNVDELFTTEEPCPSIKSLHLKEIPLKMHTLGNILFMFPALTKIQVKLEVFSGLKDLLRMFWTRMTQLEDLDLQIGEPFQIDPLFTGLRLQQCQNIKLSNAYLRGLKSLSEEEWTEEILELAAVRTYPSIANLTNLRRLRLCFPSGGYRMSDVTACFALMHLKFLRHISADMCQLSENCCQLLVTQMKLESWEFLNCPRWTILYAKNPAENNIIPPKLYPYAD